MSFEIWILYVTLEIRYLGLFKDLIPANWMLASEEVISWIDTDLSYS